MFFALFWKNGRSHTCIPPLTLPSPSLTDTDWHISYNMYSNTDLNITLIGQYQSSIRIFYKFSLYSNIELDSEVLEVKILFIFSIRMFMISHNVVTIQGRLTERYDVVKQWYKCHWNQPCFKKNVFYLRFHRHYPRSWLVMLALPWKHTVTPCLILFSETSMQNIYGICTSGTGAVLKVGAHCWPLLSILLWDQLCTHFFIFSISKCLSHSLAVESEHVLLVSSNQDRGAVEATGQSVQPGHVQSTGAVTVWHRKAPGKEHHFHKHDNCTTWNKVCSYLTYRENYFTSQMSARYGAQWPNLSHLWSEQHCAGNSRGVV